MESPAAGVPLNREALVQSNRGRLTSNYQLENHSLGEGTYGPPAACASGSSEVLLGRASGVPDTYQSFWQFVFQ